MAGLTPDSMFVSHGNVEGTLELLELDRLDTAFAVGVGRDADTKRRLMTLFVNNAKARSYGSSGYVCKAFNSLGEVFAVKRLRSNRAVTPLPGQSVPRATKGQIAAFEEEYRSQLQLANMRGFPRLYGLGYAGQDPVIIMEWVDGITLDEARRGLPKTGDGVDPMVVGHLGRALFSILKGLDHLSDRPVHRDISPSNIMVRTSEHSLEEQAASGDFDLCLIDFGSATVVRDGDARFTMLTDVWRNGTPEYAPPEMLTHDVPDVEQLRQSPSIDVYASCSVLYELLVGRTPFRVNEQQAASPYRLKMEQEPDPLPETYGVLGQAIMGGLARDQEQRLSASEMLDRCSRFVGAQKASSVAPAGGAVDQIPPVKDFETTHLQMSTVPRGNQAEAVKPPVGEPAVSASAAGRPLLSRRAFVAGAASLAAVALLGAGAYSFVRRGSQDAGESGAADDVVPGSSAADTVPYEGGTLLLAQDPQTMLWGYVNSQRQWVIEPRFADMPGFFSEGLACATDPDSGLVGFLNYEDNWAVEPRFATAGTFYEDGLAPAQAPGEFDDKLGWVDKTGAWAIEPFCEAGGAFRQGMAPFSRDAATSASARYGFIDTTGAVAIEAAFYDAHAFTADGLAVCADHVSHWGWIDQQGSWVVQPSYAKAGGFSEGLAAAMDNLTEAWGYVDAAGNLAIAHQFADARAFSAGLAAVQDSASRLWGCVDQEGQWVVEPTFAQLGEFNHGLAPAQDETSQLFGYVDD